jgi:ProP effector
MRSDQTRDVIIALAKRFPHAFVVASRRRRPLKVGIYRDLIAIMPGMPDRFKVSLQCALAWYTSSWHYQRTLKEGVVRIDLDGKPAGVVTAKQAAHARARTKRQVAKRGIDNDAVIGNIRFIV